jgi:hypothetical protein
VSERDDEAKRRERARRFVWEPDDLVIERDGKRVKLPPDPKPRAEGEKEDAP